MKRKKQKKSQIMGNTTIIILTIAVSALFIYLIKGMLIALFTATLIVAVSQPLYKLLYRVTKGKANISSLLSMLILTIAFIIPCLFILILVTNQAISLGKTITPFVANINQDDLLIDHQLTRLPFYEYLEPYKMRITSAFGDFISFLSSSVAKALSSIGSGALSFFTSFFVMLYAMFFLFKDGNKILDKFLYLLPLSSRQEKILVENFVKVSKASLKGIFVIGSLQGLCAAIIFYFVGLPNSIFWGTILAISTIIPVVGTAIVWIPASLFLAIFASPIMALVNVVLCAGLVGSIDNLLRPIVVGKDTNLPDLLIFLSTLGGIGLFGLAGIIIGPLIASFFVSILDLFGEAFSEILPPVQKNDEKKNIKAKI